MAARATALPRNGGGALLGLVGGLCVGRGVRSIAFHLLGGLGGEPRSPGVAWPFADGIERSYSLYSQHLIRWLVQAHES